MAEANDGHEGSDDSMTERRACHQCDDKKIPWRLVSFIAIAAVVLLVGLPIGTVLIVNLSGCCLTSGPEHIITFWASMIAGFLTLFGMVVTGVFVLVAFKTKEIAKAEAQSAAVETAQNVSQFEAQKAAETFIKNRRGWLFQEFEKAVDDVAEQAANVQKLGQQVEEATNVMTTARDKVTSAANDTQAIIDETRDRTTNMAIEAQNTIGEARVQTGNAANEAQGAIGEARVQTASVANEAQRAISEASREVQQQRRETTQAIISAQEEVEAAARTARDRIDRTGDTPQDEDEPE